MASLQEWTSFATNDLTPLPGGNDVRRIAAQPIPFNKLARVSGYGEIQNISTITNDIAKIQNYIRQAERGDMTLLYGLYRDILIGDSHIQAELGKRKLVVSGQPYNIQPINKDNPEDVKAADAIKWMIEHCDNWDDGMNHLLDASLIAAVSGEKIFEPYISKPNERLSFRFRLKQIAPVNYQLYTYLVAYIPQGGIGLPAMSPRLPNAGLAENPALIYDPDEWEPELRFFSVFDNGIINRSWQDMYAPIPDRHIIHRATLFPGIRDNYGAAMRALVFWWYLGANGRDWFARFMEKYGAPFIAGKVNTNDATAVANITQAFSNATKLSGIIIDKTAEVDIKQAMVSNAASGYETYLNFCNREKSKLILGHADASESKREGLTKGTGNQVDDVRHDIQQYDKKKLANTLKRQLFAQFLQINGLTGEPPNIVWSGQSREETNQIADTFSKLKLAGIQPTDDALEALSEEIGYQLERAPEPTATPNSNANGSKTKSAGRD
jgi:Protein of unknown function (DUF935)